MPLKLTIKRIENENSRIRVFYLSAAQGGNLPPYTAGAHIDVTLEGVGTRSYSLIDFEHTTKSPMEYCIAVQREDEGQGGSAAMHRLDEGDVLTAEGPTNDFELQISPQSPSVLLAGGIGVTPLISMATYLKQTGAQFQFHYSARNKEAMGFADLLATTFSDRLSMYLDNQNPLVLKDLFNTIGADSSVYICGPRGMIDAAREAAITAGINAENIHIELFTSPDMASDDTDFEIELQSTGQIYTVPPGKSIIDVLQEANIEPIFDCQRGDCGICQTDVISGIPDHRDVVLTDTEKESGKVMQICVSRAKSKRLVLDL